MQMGGVYVNSNEEEGILLHKHRNSNGRCIAILFKVLGSVVDVCDSLDSFVCRKQGSDKYLPVTSSNALNLVHFYAFSIEKRLPKVAFWK